MNDESKGQDASQALDVIIAVALEQAGKTDEAIKYYRQAIDNGPENGTLRYSLGLVYIRASRIYDAIAELRESVKIAPNHGDTYAALATCYSVLGMAPWEAVYHRAYLDFADGSDQAATARARLRELEAIGVEFPVTGFLNAAKQEFDERRKGIVDHTVGEKWQEMSRCDQIAIERYISAALMKTWAFPHFANAAGLSELNRYWAAIGQLILGLQQGPESQGALVMLATCYAEVGRYDQARKVVELVNLERAESDEKEGIRRQYDYLRGELKSGKK